MKNIIPFIPILGVFLTIKLDKRLQLLENKHIYISSMIVQGISWFILFTFLIKTMI